MPNKKHEPITIDVKPEEITIEAPRRPAAPMRQPRQPKWPAPRRPRTMQQKARELDNVGEILQSPNFWIGLVADLWVKGKRR